MKPIYLAFGAAATVLAGCATIERGSVAETYPNGIARVYLGSADGLQAGTRVNFYQLNCLDEMIDSFRDMHDDCDKLLLGGGIVAQVLSRHESMVNIDQGVKLSGDIRVKLPGNEALQPAH